MQDHPSYQGDGSSAPGDLPLTGLRVVDFTQALAGPYATLLLADLGADVIKVERPDRGDDSRGWGPPFVGDDSAYFLSVNRNKRSVALDLKSDQGVEAARRLASTCDVLVENWRPGTAARLGIGATRMRELNPRLVYCSISAFGQDEAPAAGYDQIIQGMAGLMSLTGDPDGLPTKFGIPITDLAAGMFAVQGVLAALLQRARTGLGRQGDVAMHDSAISLLSYQAGRYFATGDPPRRDGNVHPTIAPYATLATVDGYVNIAVGNDAQWQRLCRALGIVDVTTSPRFATNADRVRNRDELYALLESITTRVRTTDLLATLTEYEIPAGPIRRLDEVFTDPLAARRKMILAVERDGSATTRAPGGPWKFDGGSVQVRFPPPALGADTAAVLTEVGFSLEEVEGITAGREFSRPVRREAPQ